ncbi:hypothetical protein Y032_0710g1727 [Ancylostoma ceylanicum]|uniref:Uncharacterized protein n=1 Tax=Ancylostoma ceylanicum TaxID=53326 RepID=A0A016WHU6_9BILA|nr:hypothetical protein Y032_0710g1727 [Ancylostoma ceylanicum]
MGELTLGSVHHEYWMCPLCITVDSTLCHGCIHQMGELTPGCVHQNHGMSPLRVMIDSTLCHGRLYFVS